MIANNPPTILQRSPYSFETMRPGVLAAWLMAEHSFVEQVPMASKAYRLTMDGMVVTIFPYGLVLTEGRNMTAAAMLLSDLCDSDGGGK